MRGARQRLGNRATALQLRPAQDLEPHEPGRAVQLVNRIQLGLPLRRVDDGELVQRRDALGRDARNIGRRKMNCRNEKRERGRAAVDGPDQKHRDQVAENGLRGLDFVAREVLDLKSVMIVEQRLSRDAGGRVGDVDAVTGDLVQIGLIGHGPNLSKYCDRSTRSCIMASLSGQAC